MVKQKPNDETVDKEKSKNSVVIPDSPQFGADDSGLEGGDKTLNDSSFLAPSQAPTASSSRFILTEDTKSKLVKTSDGENGDKPKNVSVYDMETQQVDLDDEELPPPPPPRPPSPPPSHPHSPRKSRQRTMPS